MQTLKDFRNIFEDPGQKSNDDFKRSFLQLFVEKIYVDGFPVGKAESRQTFVVVVCFDKQLFPEQNSKSFDKLLLVSWGPNVDETIEKVKQWRQVKTAVVECRITAQEMPEDSSWKVIGNVIKLKVTANWCTCDLI